MCDWFIWKTLTFATVRYEVINKQTFVIPLTYVKFTDCRWDTDKWRVSEHVYCSQSRQIFVRYTTYANVTSKNQFRKAHYQATNRCKNRNRLVQRQSGTIRRERPAHPVTNVQNNMQAIPLRWRYTGGCYAMFETNRASSRALRSHFTRDMV